MSIEAAFVAWANGNAGIAAIVGSRIYPDRLPQNASFPAMTYAKASHHTVKSLGGLTGLSKDGLTIACWGLTKADAKGLARAVRGNKSSPGLDGFRGTVAGVNIQAAFCDNEIDLYDPPVHGDDSGVYHTQLDFDISYEDV